MIARVRLSFYMMRSRNSFIYGDEYANSGGTYGVGRGIGD